MDENKNNSKNEYNVGYSGEFFDEFPDFDSLDSTPKQTVQKKSTAQSYEEKLNITDEEDENQYEKSKNKAKKSARKFSASFIALCTVLVIAIIGCSALSVFSINKFMNSSGDEKSSDVKDTISYNEYNELVPKYASTKYPSGISSELTRLFASNNDVVGWLYVAGTNVNTPVVQSKDNNHYLRYNYFGSYTNYGTTYADYRCKVQELSKNTVIYGHNMPSGTHFYDVNRYEDIEWYKKNPVITYSTLYDTYTFLIYTAFYSTVNGKDDGGYVFNYIYPNMSDSNFKGYIEQVNQRALYTTAVDLKSTDKIITLSTCNHTYDSMCGQDVDSRLVVIGRLLRSGESAEVNTNTAKENTNYRRPQIWYNKKGKTNPYSNSRSWAPSK